MVVSVNEPRAIEEDPIEEEGLEEGEDGAEASEGEEGDDAAEDNETPDEGSEES